MRSQVKHRMMEIVETRPQLDGYFYRACVCLLLPTAWGHAEALFATE